MTLLPTLGRGKMLLKSFEREEKGITHRTRPENPTPDIQGFLVSMRLHLGRSEMANM